jgi:protein-disulfide isomerase
MVWMAVTQSRLGATTGKAAPSARRSEPALPADPISLTGAEVLGDRSAKAALIIYSDFQCPYCGKFARETLPAIQKQYVDTGKLLLAFRQFPLPIHQFAERAAEASECAGRQGKFWPFHDQLFANQDGLDDVSLLEKARVVGLQPEQFAQCLAGQTTAIVQDDKKGAGPRGVSGTPTFFAGAVLGDGRVKVSQRLTGALPLAQFQAVLDSLGGHVASALPTGQK